MLNFDPYRWMAEQQDSEPTLAGLATLAGSPPENEKSVSSEPPAKPAKAAKVDRPLSDAEARSTLRQWHRWLSPLDEHFPPAGFDPARWRVLKADSWWIYEQFASQAVRTGWSALDLFGVLPADHKLGGLVARLQGARNLKMGGQIAKWSSGGVADWTCATAGERLICASVALLWELPR